MKCVIVGAGVAGLMAAHTLARHNVTIDIIEGRARLGGRICTLTSKEFSIPIELGAEFIHGTSPITEGLLNAANVEWNEVDGQQYVLREGKWTNQEFQDEHWSTLLDSMMEITTDLPFAEFLQHKFSGDSHKPLRMRARSFVEGYNAADMNFASTLALREEWVQASNGIQARPTAGYQAIIDYLVRSLSQENCTIHTSQTVDEISWDSKHASAHTASGEMYPSDCLIVTVPIGVLRKGLIRFHPEQPIHKEAFDNIGVGPVVKFHFEFEEGFWREQRQISADLGFIFSDARIPTWWTRRPLLAPVLVGWIGGPEAARLAEEPEYLYQHALESLGYIFNVPAPILTQAIKAYHIANWTLDPFSHGAYSFAMVRTPWAKNILNNVGSDALYFAGEALAELPSTGTVEAALHSGISVANRIINRFKL